MKKILFVVFSSIFAINTANADCVANTPTYTACKPGYYLSAGSCAACPNNGTSADKNSGGIKDCYLPAGSSVSDSTGTYTVTGNCSHDGSFDFSGTIIK